MQIDPEKRYFLSRPRGGFNDSMVQIEKSRLYAEKFNRVLVLDTSRSGLHEQLDTLFKVPDNFGCEVLLWDRAMLPVFDAVTSVRPAELRHRISSYKTTLKEKPGVHFFDRETDCEINFDQSRDHDEQVLVYEQMGGGYASFQLLNRLVFRADVANTIIARLQSLGTNYDAVHIRHSDYKTDFNAFLSRLRPVLRGRRVLMCSDSAEAKDAAAKILHPTTTVLSVSDTPQTGGVPLHHRRNINHFDANVDLLTDLIAMSLARTLFFTQLSGNHKENRKCSGFSLLADLLGRHPKTIRHLLSAADPVAVDALLRRGPVSLNPVRWAHLLNYYRWNYGPAKFAYNRYRRSRKPLTEPEALVTRFLGT